MRLRRVLAVLFGGWAVELPMSELVRGRPETVLALLPLAAAVAGVAWSLMREETVAGRNDLLSRAWVAERLAAYHERRAAHYRAQAEHLRQEWLARRGPVRSPLPAEPAEPEEAA